MGLIFQVAAGIVLGGLLLLFIFANFREIATFVRTIFTVFLFGGGLYAVFSQNPNIPDDLKMAAFLMLSFFGFIFLVAIVGIIIVLYWERSQKFQKLTAAYSKLPKAIRFFNWALIVLACYAGGIYLFVSIACGQWGGGC